MHSSFTQHQIHLGLPKMLCAYTAALKALVPVPVGYHALLFLLLAAKTDQGAYPGREVRRSKPLKVQSTWL